jgi:hypothetical protein
MTRQTWIILLLSGVLLAPGLASTGCGRSPATGPQVTTARISTSHVYPPRQSFTWGRATLRVGMNKEETLLQLRQGSTLPGRTKVMVPGKAELGGDVWPVECQGHPAIGNVTRIRLKFEKNVLTRIQIPERLP